MTKNVGCLDRNIRIISGVVFLLIGLFTEIGTGLRIGAFALATIAFATAFVRFWPLWKVLGISTHKGEEAESAEKPVEKTGEQQEKTEEEKEKPEGQ